MKFGRVVLAMVALVAFLGLLFFSMAAWAMRKADFQSGVDLKMCAIAMQMYAADDDGDFHEYLPQLSPRAGHLMFEMDGVYPKFIYDAGLLISPADPIAQDSSRSKMSPEYCFENCSYFYLGYAVWDDATVLAFADAYKRRVEEGLPFDTDLPADPPIVVLKRLDIGIYRQMIPDKDSDKPEWAYLRHPHSELPVLIERPHPYPGPYGLFLFGPIPLSKPVLGGCVLYLDGHTEFIPYPGKWPMTQKTIETLRDIAATSSRVRRDI
jgi:hypothetical protein